MPPPKFLTNQPNTSQLSSPKTYRDQLIPESATDLLPSIIANFNSPNYDPEPNKDYARVIKVFTTSKPKVGSVPYFLYQGENITVSHCMAISVNKTNKFAPLPEETGDNLSNSKDKTLTNISIYCFDDKGNIQAPLKVGDLIPIEFVNGKMEARIIGKASNDIAEADGSDPSAKDAHNNGDGSTVAPSQTTGGGSKDDPSFASCKASTYPNLEKKPTKFLKYSKEQVISSFNKISTDKTLKSMAFAILSMEQGNFSFPNNNVSGIQLDFGKGKGFANTTESDFDYQTCFKDNGGDQRIFAGFNTLERGLQTFIKIIQGKINIGAFKTPTGSLEQQSSIMADNYYSSWNIAATPTELALLKTQGYFVRNGTRVERHYAATKQIFYNTLGVFS